MARNIKIELYSSLWKKFGIPYHSTNVLLWTYQSFVKRVLVYLSILLLWVVSDFSILFDKKIV